MMKYIIIVILLFISGCITVTEQRQRTSSYYTGCASNEIEIKNGESSENGNTWTAICHGKKFYCDEKSSPSCKEQTKEETRE